MGTGTHAGPNRTLEAARKALECPILEGRTLSEAHGLLFTIWASPPLKQAMAEAEEAIKTIEKAMPALTDVSWNLYVDEECDDECTITFIALTAQDSHIEEASMSRFSSDHPDIPLIPKSTQSKFDAGR